LAQRLLRGLREIRGVRVWTSADPTLAHAVVSFDPAGLDPHELQERLYVQDRIVCAARTGADRPGLRFSPHFYNSPSEVERALKAVRRAVQGRA
jgi:selenocysteine lyase/cysteine desulfurase